MVFLAAEASASFSEGLLNMAAGLITVFAVLVFLCLIIALFGVFSKKGRKTAAAAPAKAAPAAAPAPAVPAAPKGPGTMASATVSFAGDIPAQTAAVILAAVAEEEGGSFKVTSIKKAV